MKPRKSRAEALLSHAAGVIADRTVAYGDATDAMTAVAKRWSLTLGVPVSAAQVVLCLIDVKFTRLVRNPQHQDSLVDVIGYTAMLREVTP